MDDLLLIHDCLRIGIVARGFVGFPAVFKECGMGLMFNLDLIVGLSWLMHLIKALPRIFGITSCLKRIKMIL